MLALSALSLIVGRIGSTLPRVSCFTAANQSDSFFRRVLLSMTSDVRPRVDKQTRIPF